MQVKLKERKKVKTYSFNIVIRYFVSRDAAVWGYHDTSRGIEVGTGKGELLDSLCHSLALATSNHGQTDQEKARA